MNLQLHELINLNYELNGMAIQQGEESKVISQGLLKQKMSLKLKVYLQRLNTAIAQDIKLYEEARQELFKKYGEEKDGTITVPTDKIAEFNKEQNDLLTAQKEVNVSTLWGSDLTLDSLASVETDETYPVLFKLIDNN